MTSMCTRPHPGARCIAVSAALLLGVLAAAAAAAKDDTVYAAVTSERSTVYVGETFMLVVEVHSPGPTLDKNMTLGAMPKPEVLEYLAPFAELAEQETDTHHVYRFGGWVRAKKPGPLDIAPRLGVTLWRKRRSLWGSSHFGQSLALEARPLRLTVKPLPSPAPDSFCGAVGRFNFSASTSTTNPAVGDLVKLTLTITGTGSLDTVSAPRVTAAPHFKIYDPKVVIETPWRMLSFEQILVPQDTHATPIPPVVFTYFNTVSGSYETHRRGPFPLTFHVAKVENLVPFRPPDTAVLRPPDAKVPLTDDLARLSERWRTDRLALATIAYGIAVACFALALASRVRRPLLVVLVVLGVGLLLSTALRPVMVRRLPGQVEKVLTREVEARLAPGDAALPTFNIANKAAVRVITRHNDWLLVIVENRRGWIPAEAIATD